MKKKTIYQILVVAAITYLIAKINEIDKRMNWIEAQQDNVIEILIEK